MIDLSELAKLLRIRNSIDGAIARIIGRPAHSGHISEFVASSVFKIDLVDSASNRSIDGYFTEGLLAGKSVNVKWQATNQHLLDATRTEDVDYYLVLSGPRAPAGSSRGKHCPYEIRSVYVFDARELGRQIRLAGVKLGLATGVRRELWEAAEIYPDSRSPLLVLSQAQREMIELFGEAPCE